MNEFMFKGFNQLNRIGQGRPTEGEHVASRVVSAKGRGQGWIKDNLNPLVPTGADVRLGQVEAVRTHALVGLDGKKVIQFKTGGDGLNGKRPPNERLSLVPTTMG